jgi:hypothetical protein
MCLARCEDEACDTCLSGVLPVKRQTATADKCWQALWQQTSGVFAFALFSFLYSCCMNDEKAGIPKENRK